TELFAVERYPTVLQMVSTVQARTRRPLSEIFRAMFPCASITGAPKVRTMEIIRELEPQPRGVYTGAIGFISPGGTAQFNVAIRTALVDRERGTAVYGVGSGIVWDSDAAAEYEECQVKAQVLAAKRPSFQLLESLLWQPGEGYFLLEGHLRRLADSAIYFDIPLDGAAARQALARFALSLAEPCKIRLLVSLAGEMEIEAVPLAQGARRQPLRVALADTAVSSENVWMYHKTTRREWHNAARAAYPDCDEVILWNERGELTEATTANVVLDMDGELVTPPVSSGLLAGTFRNHLLANGRIRERILTKADLSRARQIFLINSVRRWQTAVLV
ncbi:MAG TPA: aminodeoxychorismate synthase, component I, partial [Chloroflexi bacterium]|nr:aminodeoxychorismate synthase, component I [Chloroflexota bacterium]